MPFTRSSVTKKQCNKELVSESEEEEQCNKTKTIINKKNQIRNKSKKKKIKRSISSGSEDIDSDTSFHGNKSVELDQPRKKSSDKTTLSKCKKRSVLNLDSSDSEGLSNVIKGKDESSNNRDLDHIDNEVATCSKFTNVSVQINNLGLRDADLAFELQLEEIVKSERTENTGLRSTDITAVCSDVEHLNTKDPSSSLQLLQSTPCHVLLDSVKSEIDQVSQHFGANEKLTSSSFQSKQIFRRTTRRKKAKYLDQTDYLKNKIDYAETEKVKDNLDEKPVCRSLRKRHLVHLDSSSDEDEKKDLKHEHLPIKTGATKPCVVFLNNTVNIEQNNSKTLDKEFADNFSLRRSKRRRNKVVVISDDDDDDNDIDIDIDCNDKKINMSPAVKRTRKMSSPNNSVNKNKKHNITKQVKKANQLKKKKKIPDDDKSDVDDENENSRNSSFNSSLLGDNFHTPTRTSRLLQKKTERLTGSLRKNKAHSSDDHSKKLDVEKDDSRSSSFGSSLLDDDLYTPIRTSSRLLQKETERLSRSLRTKKEVLQDISSRPCGSASKVLRNWKVRSAPNDFVKCTGNN